MQGSSDLMRDRLARRLPAVSSGFLSEMITTLRDLIRTHDANEEARFAPHSELKGRECEAGSLLQKITTTFAEFAKDSMDIAPERENAVVILLESIALAVSGDGGRVQTFASMNGFEMLHECFVSDASSTSSTLSLWMIFHFISCATPAYDFSHHDLVVQLFKAERLSSKKRMLVASIFQS
jgi:hypothetical protein